MEIPFLTKGESKVYKTLIEIGESRVGDIIKMSCVSHSKIYEILKRLSNKGLVSAIIKNNRQYFKASPPVFLREIINEEKEKIKNNEKVTEEIIKMLGKNKETSKVKSILSSYEGIKGMNSVLNLILDDTGKDEEILILGSPKKIGEYSGGFLKEWQKKRIKKSIICKIITDSDSIQWNDNWWIKSKKNKITLIKKSNTISPSYLVITEKYVLTVYFSNVILSILIKHPEIAKRYIESFNQIWKT
jgi:sugar-specific transcriptional regulator TrmB